MSPWVCDTCGLELSSKNKLHYHLNKKTKCLPPGQVRVEIHECTTCDKKFKRKNLLEQHFGTEKHKRAVAGDWSNQDAGGLIKKSPSGPLGLRRELSKL